MTAEMPIARSRRLPTPAAVFAVFAFLAPLAPLLAQRVMVVLLGATVLAALGLHVARHRRLALPGRWRLIAVVAAFVALGAASTAWSLNWRNTAQQAAQYFGAMVCLIAAWPLIETFDQTARRRIGSALAAGVCLAAVVVAGNAVTGYPLERLLHRIPAETPVPGHLMNKGILTLALMAWPAALALWLEGRRIAAALMPLGIAALLLPLDTQTASAAALCAIAAAAFTALAGRAAIVVMGGVLLAVVLTLPLLVHQMAVAGWDTAAWMPDSWRHRVFIWNFIAERVGDKPLLGWGFDAGLSMSNFGVTPPFGYKTAIPTHAHNNFLQIWMELGAAGIVLLLAIVLLPLARIRDLAPGPRAFAAGAWGVTLAAALPGYGAGQTWWLFTILAQAVLCAALLGREKAP